MQWKIAQAKQRLSEVLRCAEREPQEILNRERLVAVVLGAKDEKAFREWQQAQGSHSLAEALKEAQRLCQEEEYSLPTVARRDRDNPLLWVNDGGLRNASQAKGVKPKGDKHSARRHQRGQ
jgi:hypothetical protein